MREVSACDFCGASDAGTFEVLPPEVDGGRRMVLCDGCRETLGGVVEPLLGHAASGDDVEPAVGDGVPDAGSTSRPAESAEDPTTADGDPADADARRDAGHPDDGETAGEASAGDEDDDERGDESDRTTPEGEAGASSGAGDDGAKMAATGAGRSSGVPRGYRKTVRFLENREFPMERERAVSMTSDAYGLDEEAVHAAIDHALKHDRLKEFDGELRKP